MELVIGLALLIGLIWKGADWFKQLTNKDWNGAGTQLFLWVLGVVIFLIASSADAFEALIVPGMEKPLGDLNFWSILLIGISATSSGSVAYDFKKAIDGKDSAKMPQMFPSASSGTSPNP